MCWRRAPPSARSVLDLDKTMTDGNRTENRGEHQKKQNRRPGTRRLVQLYAALLYNANLKGYIDGRLYSGEIKAVCVPGLNCYSCPGAVASCPLGSLQNALNAAGHTALWYVLGMLALFGVLLGRTICGWICPLGLIQELLHKIPTPKIRKNWITRKLSGAKYVFLVVFVIAIPLIYGVGKGILLPGFCKYICPAGTLEGAVGLLQHPANSSSFLQLKAVFTSKWVIMLAIGLVCVFCYRSFCRFICPLGAIYSFFNRFALTGVKVNPDRCNGCGQCVTTCRMDVRHVGDRECISCGKCIDACAQGAISMKCGRITLMGPEIGKNADPKPVIQKRKRAGRLAWGIALAALAFAICWFNFIEPASREASPPAAAATEEGKTAPLDPGAAALTVGTEIGNLAPDFSTELLSGKIFRLSDYRGQVVIINFWTYTCAPCIEELPYFEQLKADNPEVEILAVHHQAGANRAEAFLADKGWDHLDFALDSREKGILSLLNVSDAMPQTMILNRQGVVTYNAQAPLTREQLEALYHQALANGPEPEIKTAAESAAEQGNEPKPEEMEGPDPVAGQEHTAVPAVTYTAKVVDQNGDPVPDVLVAFCTKVACWNSDGTDEQGIASMTLQPAAYHLQVISAPEGYDWPNDTEIYVGPEAGEGILEITKTEAED